MGNEIAMKKIASLFFSIVFYAGVLFGFLLTSMATWADMEAVSYEFDRTGGEHLNSLHCPILMTAKETSIFSVTLTNTTDKKLTPSIRTDISARLEPVSSYTYAKLAPGETKHFHWTIGPENIKFRQFIFVRAWVNASYPLPSRSNVCGVFVLDLPTNGNVITWSMVGLSITGIAVGLYGITRSRDPMKNKRADMMLLGVVAFLIVTGIITSLMGWWMQGGIVVVLSILVILVSLCTARR